ncbi:unnamed protein product [Cuscuta epithymum]|uniref:Uncharacterized protein n=1 Tax=Cuscuta epithymum TaxID=186058 RepID=A0AAV0DSM0_9ASTE|nr:unnamed protein product [Cuscuta epithymum]
MAYPHKLRLEASNFLGLHFLVFSFSFPF